MSLSERVSQKHGEASLVWPGRVEARLYQQTIAENACCKNTLVVLPTALGKTVISALAAAHFLYSYKQMRVLVMAPTRPLVLQHRETYMRILKLAEDDAITLTGKTPAAAGRPLGTAPKRRIEGYECIRLNKCHCQCPEQINLRQICTCTARQCQTRTN
jgi:hypothetical protein